MIMFTSPFSNMAFIQQEHFSTSFPSGILSHDQFSTNDFFLRCHGQLSSTAADEMHLSIFPDIYIYIYCGRGPDSVVIIYQLIIVMLLDLSIDSFVVDEWQ